MKSLIEARKALGLTQKQLAQSFNCTTMFISIMENGRSRVPAKMAKILIKKLEKNGAVQISSALKAEIEQDILKRYWGSK